MKPLYQHLGFVDSFKYMNTSLEKLVNATPAEDLKNMQKMFGNKPLDPEKYKVIPFNQENGRIIQLREIIDKRKMEYINVSHADNFELGSRSIKAVKLKENAQLTLMKDYLSRVNKQGECLMKNGFGRNWTDEKFGIINMSRKIRHILCQETMYGIDMKMHILDCYVHENGINCLGLDAYIENREKYMQIVDTK